MNTLPKKNLSKRVALLAVILALTFVTALLPAVFLLPLIIASILLGTFGGFIASLFFAGVSLMYAFVMPVSPAALSFIMHPWVAIVPRLPLGIICFLCYTGVRRLTKNAKSKFVKETLPVSLGAMSASILNTALVVGCLVIFYANDTVLDTTVLLSVPYMLIMGVIEAVAVSILAPLIIWALKKTPVYRLGGFNILKSPAHSLPTKTGGGSEQDKDSMNSDTINLAHKNDSNELANKTHTAKHKL